MNDRNYLNDHRVRAAEERDDREELGFDQKRMTLTFTIEDDEGCEQTYTLPARFAVCPTCDGKGSHVNPSVDADGITAGEWEQWDGEEREQYMRGDYDVPCYGCDGQRVVPEVDVERLNDEGKRTHALLQKQQRDEAEYRAMCRAERMMGA